MSSSNITTSQTIGPFPHEAWRWAFDSGSSASADSLVITGRVFDGNGETVSDAILEASLPGATGGGAVDGMPGFWRVPSGEDGEFRLSLPRSGDAGAPACFITLFGRGVVKHQFCAVFVGDDAALGDSPLLAQVPAERRATLIAQPTGDGSYRWDIHLQGADETVFFDYA